MSASILDLATIRARRAAAAAEAAAAAQKRDPLSNPFAVLFARLILDLMILDKEIGKMRAANEYLAMMRAISTRRQS